MLPVAKAIWLFATCIVSRNCVVTAAQCSSTGPRIDCGGNTTSIELSSTSVSQPELGADIQSLQASIESLHNTLRVTIRDAEKGRYEVPKELFSRLDPDPIHNTFPATAPAATATALVFDYSQDPFHFIIARAENASQYIFNSSATRFIYKDQYLEITSSVPADTLLFGLGERTSSTGLALQRDGVPITLWNRDKPSRYVDQNLYGSHPFILQLDPDGNASGILLMNSNGMDLVLTEDTISYRVIGGILDFYYFAGPTPGEVLRQYASIVGYPSMPPVWSLGFHNCKYGYKSVEELEEVVANYSAAQIPLDTMWTDIDYMEHRKDFTLDQQNFPQDRMQVFVETLHAQHQHYVMIVDPGIKVEPGYNPYDRGMEADIFLQDATGLPYLGQVWPGAVHFPDFLDPDAPAYWGRELRDFHDMVAYDGLWIDMNEASNFCTGEVCRPGATPAMNESTQCFLECRTVSNGSQAALLQPPYAIDNGNQRLPLMTATIPPTAVHASGDLEYDVHNLYGLAEAKVTAEALRNVTGREKHFLLTRSSFLGSGAYAAHWTGDNAATWDDLRWSIPSILRSGLNVVPFVGADICGFQEYTTEQLCARWVATGAFYPFSRVHSDLGSGYQELYRWDSVGNLARSVLGLRYALLPYLQLYFAEAAGFGRPVARPLWFEFPQDRNTHAVDQQWMIGEDILVCPVLHENATNVTAYLPAGKWYNAFMPGVVEGPGLVTLDSPWELPPRVFFREGGIIPMQRPRLTIPETQQTPFSLTIALPDMAAGSSTVIRMELWLQPEEISTGRREASLTARALGDASLGGDGCMAGPLPALQAVTLLGWNGSISDVSWEGKGNAEASISGGLTAALNDLDINWGCKMPFRMSWS